MKIIKLSHYYLLGSVGRGQFGEVFCAYDFVQSQLVALKAMEPGRFSTQRFLRELRFLVTFNHPNIISCQGLTHHNSQRYLIMDYCEAGTLRDLISKSQLSFQDSLAIIIDVLAGLAQVHAQGIVHCDLKPENILLTLIHQGWRAKISDFGIAKTLQETKYSVSLGDTGSPAYMAPERFYGKFSTTSDLYSVGIILYELIMGERPFSGTPQELITAHLNQSPLIPPNVPFFLRSVLLKALEKLPQHRFSTAGAMMESLQMALEIVKATKTTTAVIEKFTPVDFLVDGNRDGLAWQLLETFSEPIVSIAGGEEGLYQAQHQQILTKTGKIDLKEPVLRLELCPSGCLAWTQGENHLYLYRILGDQAHLILTIPRETIVSRMDSHGQWLGWVEDASHPQLTLYNWRRGCYWYQSLSFIPTQLLILDSSHGMSVSTQGDLGTEFNFFNRRGHWYKGFSLEISCQKLVVNRYHPYTLVGTDGDMGLMIELKPLRVSRFNWQFIPDFIIPQDWGYFLASGSGAIALVTLTGETLSNYQLSVDTITAVSSTPGAIILASWVNNQAYLMKILISSQITGKTSVK